MNFKEDMALVKSAMLVSSLSFPSVPFGEGNLSSGFWFCVDGKPEFPSMLDLLLASLVVFGEPCALLDERLLWLSTRRERLPSMPSLVIAKK